MAADSRWAVAPLAAIVPRDEEDGWDGDGQRRRGRGERWGRVEFDGLFQLEVAGGRWSIGLRSNCAKS